MRQRFANKILMRRDATYRTEKIGLTALGQQRSLIIYVTGIIDSIGFVQYLLDADQVSFYIALILIKLGIFSISKWDARSLYPALPFLGAVAIGVFISSASNPVELIDVVRVLMSALSIVLTLAIIDGDLDKYSAGLSINGFIISILYILQYHLGSILVVYERSYFFGGTHPNLGGEILSMILIMSTICLKPPQFALLFSLSAYACWLMQSRTSILAMAISAALYTLFWFLKRYGTFRGLIILSSLAASTLSFLAVDAVYGAQRLPRAINFVYESVFLVEDSYRGAGSGLSGRDEHWNETFSIIENNFFAGAGIEYPRRLDILQPHSWFLYPVALFGLIGYAAIAFMIHSIAKVARNNKEEITRILPIIVLMTLNDRFMNLNINPLAIYIYIFARIYKPVSPAFASSKAKISNLHPRDIASRARRLRPETRLARGRARLRKPGLPAE